jgi:hypothetical protein
MGKLVPNQIFRQWFPIPTCDRYQKIEWIADEPPRLWCEIWESEERGWLNFFNFPSIFSSNPIDTETT